MQATMNKNKTSLVVASVVIPLLSAILILLAAFISMRLDEESFGYTELNWSPKEPVCLTGQIGVFPPDHPIVLDLLQLYPKPTHTSSFFPFPSKVTPITGDFMDNCVDKLYEPASSAKEYGSGLIGCIDFTKIPSTPQPFPTTLPTTTNLVQYDMFVQTRSPIMKPQSEGDFYTLEANVQFSQPGYCFPPYVTAVTNLASVGILRHHGLYTQPPPPPATLNVFDPALTDIASQYGISPTTSTSTTYQDIDTQQDTDPIQPHNDLASDYGPFADVNTKLWNNPNLYSDASSTYYTAIAHQSLTILFFLPVFFFLLIPYTEAKQSGHSAQLLINGIRHYNILLTALFFTLVIGIPTMMIYAWLSFLPFNDIFPIGSMVFFYVMYFLAATSFVLLIGSIVTRTRPAAQVLIGVFGIFTFIGFFLEDIPHWISYVLSPICFQFTYSLAWRTFLLYITHDQSLHFDHYASSLYGYSYARAIILFFVNIIITGLLSLYFQQIVPTQGVVAKPWNFIFYPSSWAESRRSTRALEQGTGVLEYGPIDATRFTPLDDGTTSSSLSSSTSPPIRSNANVKTRSHKRKYDINHINDLPGVYSQQIDSDEGEEGQGMDDLENAEDFIEDNERAVVDNDPSAAHDYDDINDTNIGYLPPIHPPQPLSDYERENVTISFNNVRKTFTNLHDGTRHAIKRLNLDISRQIVFLTGKNGSGKTLLFELILGLTPPTAGHIRVQLPTSNVNVDGQVIDQHLQRLQSSAYSDPFATNSTSEDPFASSHDASAQITTNNVDSDDFHNYPSPHDSDVNNLGSTNQNGNEDMSGHGNNFIILNNQLSAQQFQHRPLYGYSSQTNAGLYSNFTPNEQLRYISELMQLSTYDSTDYLTEAQIAYLIDDISRRLGINSPSILDSQIHNLPLGIQKLVSIACACLHSPHIILLDSPFTYLDLSSQRHVWDLLQYLKTMGSSVIIADHNVHDIELADKVGVLSNGNLLLYGEPKWLKETYKAGYSLIIQKDVKDVHNELISQQDTFGGNQIHIENNNVVNSTNNNISDEKNQTIVEMNSMNSLVNSVGSNNNTTSAHNVEKEEDLVTTALGKSIYTTLRNLPKFSPLISLLHDSTHEMYWSISTAPASNNSPHIDMNYHQLIPQFISYLESQKHALGIKSLHLSMKTMDDIFLAANQGKSSLVYGSDDEQFGSIQNSIAEGTLPDIVYNLERKHFEERTKKRKQLESAKKFETNLDDNNSPNLRTNTTTTTSTTTTDTDTPSYVASADDINYVDNVLEEHALHSGQMDSINDGTSGYANMNTTLDLWTYNHKQTRESSILPQVAGYLRKEYLILWQTPSKLGYLIFVPLFLILAIFLTAPYNIFLFNSTPAIPLTLAGLPHNNLVEYGLSTPPTTPNPFPAPASDAVQFMRDMLNPSYILTPEARLSLPYDFYDVIFDSNDFEALPTKGPRTQHVSHKFAPQEVNDASVFANESQYDYKNPRLIGFLMSANSTYDASMNTFHDVKGTIYSNTTALPLAWALNSRLAETLFNFAVKQKTSDGQTSSSTASMLLLPSMTQIYAQQNFQVNLGYSAVLGFLLMLGLATYPIIQTYYYTRDRVTGWDDVCTIHGLYKISRWSARAIYDISIYVVQIFVLSLAVSLSGYGTLTKELFVNTHHHASVLGHFFVFLLVCGIQFLLFMHCVSYFFRDPIKAQTFFMITLFAPAIVLVLMMISFVIPPVAILCFFIGSLFPTVLIMAGVLFTYQLPESIWILILISLMASALLLIFAVFSAVTETFNVDTFIGKENPSAIVQDAHDHSPFRHIYVSDSARQEALDVTTVYTKDTHPIRAMGLYKKYGYLAAVNDVSFGVEKGSLLTLLGPRGCGRSTILELLLNLEKCTPTTDTRPHHGDICGQNTQTPSIEGVFHDEGIGYIPQTNDHLHNQLTARQILQFMGTLRGLDNEIAQAYIDYLLAVSGLNKVADKRVKTYTQGMKTRLNVICALIGNPQILIADDFVTNCDPISAKHIRQLIHHTSKARTTLLATHDVADVEALGGRVALLNHGLITAIGSIDQLSLTLGSFYSVVITTQPQSEEVGLDLIINTFNSHPNVDAFNNSHSSNDLTSSPSTLGDFVNSDQNAHNMNNIPTQPPIKLIETHQKTILFHINQHYFSLSGIFEILFSLQLSNPTIIQSYTVSHLGLSDVIRTSVRETTLSHQRNALMHNIAPTTVDYANEPEYTTNVEVVLDTTITSGAAQAIASSPSFAHHSGSGGYRGGQYD